MESTVDLNTFRILKIDYCSILTSISVVNPLFLYFESVY